MWILSLRSSDSRLFDFDFSIFDFSQRSVAGQKRRRAEGNKAGDGKFAKLAKSLELCRNLSFLGLCLSTRKRLLIDTYDFLVSDFPIFDFPYRPVGGWGLGTYLAI